MLPQTDVPPTPVERIPTIEEHLEAAFTFHGVHQEAMVDEYLRVRREALALIGEEVTSADAELDVRQFLSTNEVRRKAAMMLADGAANPVVSRETQMSVLKQLIQDFYRGKKRPGLSALTMLRAVELLNKMCGYDAPVKQEVTHEHKILQMPVIQTPFKGELPPLRVIDIDDGNGTITSIATGDSEEINPAENDLTLF